MIFGAEHSVGQVMRATLWGMRYVNLEKHFLGENFDFDLERSAIAAHFDTLFPLPLRH